MILLVKGNTWENDLTWIYIHRENNSYITKYLSVLRNKGNCHYIRKDMTVWKN